MIESGFFYPFFKNNINSNNYYENIFIFDDKYYRQIYNDIDFKNECIIPKDNNENSTLNDSYQQKLNQNNNNIINFEETLPLPNFIPEQKLYFGLKKRGKPGPKKLIKIDQLQSGKKPYIHTKNKFDNILTKIQVSYINFLVSFANVVLETYGKKELKFRFLDSKIKKNNKIENRQKLKEGTIGDILKNKISGKYSTLDKDYNFKIYKELEKDGLSDILYFLNQKFLFFFKNVYYKNLRKFNLKDFGLMDLEIELPKKIEMYENLLMKNQRDIKFEEYKIKIEKCIKKHFLDGIEEED